ncbi:MAG: glycosyltransferase family 9 protein [Syntrophotaleaceae bacterium]
MKGQPKFNFEGIREIVVLRALQLGDLLCAVPAFRSLRSAFPEAKITLVGLPWALGFVKRFHRYLDDFIEFPGFPGLPERTPDIARLPGFLHQIQSRQFDLALQMQGSGAITNPLLALFGAWRNAGFFLPGEFCPDENLFLPYPADEPEVRRHLKLMAHLGVPKLGEHLEFPLYEQDLSEIVGLESMHGPLKTPYACVHPGSRAQARRWPAEYFARVADGLAERGLGVFLTGSAEEAPLTRAVQSLMRCPAVDLAGKTSLGGIGAFLSGARLLVSNDTGLSHLAAALRIPSIVLFSASDPRRWAPLDAKLHRAVPFASKVGPDQILNEVESILNEEPVLF